MLNAWTRELGTRQGRSTPLDAPVLQGAKVFCLGFDLPSHFDEFNLGDFAQIEQTATFTPGTKLFRVHANVRPPVAPLVGLRWVLSLLIDGVELAAVTIFGGERTRVRTLTANVSKYAAGAHTVDVRLELQATTNSVLITQGGDRILTEANFAIQVEA